MKTALVVIGCVIVLGGLIYLAFLLTKNKHGIKGYLIGATLEGGAVTGFDPYYDPITDTDLNPITDYGQL